VNKQLEDLRAKRSVQLEIRERSWDPDEDLNGRAAHDVLVATRAKILDADDETASLQAYEDSLIDELLELAAYYLREDGYIGKPQPHAAADQERIEAATSTDGRVDHQAMLPLRSDHSTTETRSGNSPSRAQTCAL
jgi:hypothetical protein